MTEKMHYYGTIAEGKKRRNVEIRITYDGKRFYANVKQGKMRAVIPFENEKELKKTLNSTNLTKMFTSRKRLKKVM